MFFHYLRINDRLHSNGDDSDEVHKFKLNIPNQHTIQNRYRLQQKAPSTEPSGPAHALRVISAIDPC